MKNGWQACRAWVARVVIIGLCGCWFSLAVAAEPVVAEAAPGIAMVGGVQDYLVQSNDFLVKISARFGAPQAQIIRDNQLQPPYRFTPGTPLQLRNTHIVPQSLVEGVIINVPQRMLYFFYEGELQYAFPVTVGKPDWETPTGEFKVLDLQVNKTWVVPKSIQQEMRREGKQVRTHVPPGQDNPLGKYWIGISWAGYGIHSTIAPSSIFDYLSHGCIRVHPDDIERLFRELKLGMPVRLIYAPVLLYQNADGRVFLEVHKDVYKKGIDALAQVRSQADKLGVTERMDWTRVAQYIQQRAGVALDVTLDAGPEGAQ